MMESRKNRGDTLYKNKDNGNIKPINIILLIVVISIIIILATALILVELNGIWKLSKSDYITILSATITSYITLLGTFGTILGAYYIFKKQIENDNKIKEDIKVYHLSNLYEILRNSIIKTYIFTEYICSCYNYVLEPEEFDDDNKENVIKKGLFRISQYSKFSYLVEQKKIDREVNKDKYIKDVLNLKVEFDKATYNYTDVGMYFSVYDSNFIKEWLEIKNVDQFEDFTQVYEFLMCRDEIVRIIKEWDSKYKQDEYIDKNNDFCKGIGEIYENVLKMELEDDELELSYEE